MQRDNLCYFLQSGKIAVSSDWMIRYVKGYASISLEHLMMLVEILSNPGVFDPFKLSMTFIVWHHTLAK